MEDRCLLDASLGQHAIQLFDASPALFVQNVGQWSDPAIRYAFQVSGATVLQTQTGPVIQLFQREDSGQTGPPSPPSDPFNPVTETQPPVINSTQFSVHFAGANRVEPVGLDQAATVYNYFVGDQSNWRAGVPTFQKVGYPGLYDGIDLYTWGRRDNLKYEFHVAPGADWRQIQVQYQGTEGLSLDGLGNLHVQTSLGELVDDAPHVYQEIGGRQVEVPARFELVDAQSCRFVLTGDYDPTRELVIDPNLAWATYLGGSGNEWGYGIAVDGAGNALVTGGTQSSDFAGANNSNRSGQTAFVAKVTSGGLLAWATYLGGSDTSFGRGIAVDGTGNALVTGDTDAVSGDFPGANNSPRGSGWDGFVAKLTSGGLLAWATYLGGSSPDWGLGIAADGDGDALVTGYTYSSDFTPANNTSQGNWDSFVAKVTSGGSLAWATYLGGTGNDLGDGIAVDAAGNTLVTGYTESADFAGANNSIHGSSDAFVAKVTSGGSLAWATYLGGSGDDSGLGIAVDGAGNALVTGNTSSSDFAGANNSYDGNGDAFVAEVKPDGSLAWATYLGGSNSDSGNGIAVDGAGNALVTGGSSSSDFAGANNPYDGNGDAFVAEVKPDGSLAWATYLGGSGVDAGNGIAMDDAGNVLVMGNTSSSDFAGANNAFHGGNDVFVAKMTSAPTGVDLLAASDTGVSSTDDLTNLDNSTSGKTLQFAVSGTISGATVTIYADGAAIGSATAIGMTTTVPADGAHDLPDGSRSITARQTEPGKKESSNSPALTITVDTAAPAIPAAPQLQPTSDSNIVGDDITNVNSPAFNLSGLTSPPDYFRFYCNGTIISGNYQSGSTYSLALQPDGTYIYQVSAVDAAGNESALSGALNVTIDTTPPAAPSTPVLDPSTDSGVVGDKVTNFTKPKVTGTAETGSTVTIFSNGVAVGSSVATGGNYAITLTTALAPDGVYSIIAQTTDVAGNTGPASGALNVTIDTTPPAAPSTPVLDPSTDSGMVGDNVTNFTKPKFDGAAEAGSTVKIFSDGTLVGSGVATGGNYRITIATALADGVRNITAKAMDVAGNTGAMSGALSVTIDTQAEVPSVPVLDASTDSGILGDNITSFTLPTFDGTGKNGATVTIFSNGVAVGSGVVAVGAYHITITTALTPDGVYSIAAQATDLAGNTGGVSAPLSLTIDTTPPAVQTRASATPGTVTGTTTSLSVLGSDDGGEANLRYTWAATTLPFGATQPTFTLANGTNAGKNCTATFRKVGLYTFTVTITDAGGLTVTSSADVTVNPTFTRIVVSPASASLITGGSRQFAATGNDQFGAALETQPTFTWATTAGTISTKGILTAPGTTVSNETVTASSGTVSGTATFIVTPNQPPWVAMPAIATPAAVTGTSTSLSVSGADDGGEANLTYTWAVTDTLPVGLPAPILGINGTNAAKNTSAAFKKAGCYTFTVTIKDAGGLTATSSVRVPVTQTFTTLAVSPSLVSLRPSCVQQFTVTAEDQFGDALSTQSGFTSWMTTVGTISPDGLLRVPNTPVTNGTVTATRSTVRGTATFNVSNPPTVQTAASANPSTVTTADLSVLGADDGGEANLTYTWAATALPSGAAAPTFNVNGTNAAKNTMVTFSKAGLYAFTVTIRDAVGLTAASSVKMTLKQTFTAITVNPPVASVKAGGTQQFTATGSDQFGSALSPQPSFTWTTTAGTISTSGLLKAPNTSVSNGTVTASSGTMKSTATFNVNLPPTVQKAASANPTTVTGTTTSLSVLGADDRGEANLTYTWAATTLPNGAAAPTFSVNGTNAAKNTTATFSKSGSYMFRVTITDAGGLTATSNASVVVNLKLTTITASNAVYPLAPTLGALSNGAAGIANASATVTGTNTRKILKPVDYALALSGTWLGGPWP